MLRGGRITDTQMKLAMKRLGISADSIAGVTEVIIRTNTQEYYFRMPEVSCMVIQGMKMYQIIGEPIIRQRSPESKVQNAETQPAAKPGAQAIEVKKEPPAPSPPLFTDDDIKLVCSQTGVTVEEARKTLQECEGKPADAILKIMERKKV